MDQIAHAETIWIEAQTQITLSVHGLNGGHVEGFLLDDLNHGIPNRELVIVIKNRTTQEDTRVTRTTDWQGRFYFDPSLSDGSYAGYVEFSGGGEYRASQETFELDITRCTPRLSMQSPTRIPKGAEFAVDLQRSPVAEKSPGNACLKFPLGGMASFGQFSKKFSFEPDQLVTHLDFPTAEMEVGRYELDFSVFEAKTWHPETLSVEVFLYETLFSPELALEYEWSSITVTARLDDSLSQAGIQANLRLTASDGGSAVFGGVSDEDGRIPFRIDAMPPGCYEAALSRADRWTDLGVMHQTLCLKPRRDREWMWGILACLLLGAVTGVVVSRFKSKKLPPPPAKTADIEILERPASISGETQSLLICKDKKTGATLSVEKIHIETDKEIKLIQWPAAVDPNVNISIHHPDYITWHGKLAPGQSVCIKMTSRRDYIIDCYYAVCESVYGESIPWGTFSPEEFVEDMDERGLDENVKEDIRQFCSLVSSAAFRPDSQALEKTDEIYELSRRIVTGVHRPVYRRRR